jgi:hypothetical protein
MLQPRKKDSISAVKDNTSVFKDKFIGFKKQNVKNKTDEEYAAEREANINLSELSKREKFTKSNWREKLANDTGAISDKLRVSLKPNFFDDNINPGVMIGDMASAIGSAPLRAENKDSVMPYVGAIGAPLVAGAIAGIGAKSNKQFVNNIINPLAGSEESLLRLKDAAKRAAKGRLTGISAKIEAKRAGSSAVTGIVKDKVKDEVVQEVSDKSLPVLKIPTESTRNYTGSEVVKKESFLDKKIIPSFRTDLPKKLKLKEYENRIELKGNGRVMASIVLKKDAQNNVVRPGMIQVSDKIYGNKTQDLLYDAAVKKVQKEGYPGLRSGDNLLSPEKTIKAHERFDYVAEGKKGIGGVEVKTLLKHKNSNFNKEWFDNYQNIPKKMEKNSIRDVGEALSRNKKDIAVIGVGAATVAGMTDLMGAQMVNPDYESKILKWARDKDKLRQKNDSIVLSKKEKKQ